MKSPISLLDLRAIHLGTKRYAFYVDFVNSGHGRATLCSMKITDYVRKYAAEQGIAEDEALKKGMEEKSRKTRKRAASFTRRHSKGDPPTTFPKKLS